MAHTTFRQRKKQKVEFYTCHACRARARLSNEAFSTFLQAIKDMNAGMRGRSETLQTAADIFAGPDTDLYHDFKALLDSHLPSK